MSEDSTDLTVQQYDADVASIMAAQEDDLGEVVFQVPIMKVTQGTTKEVKAQEVEEGEFFYTLTNESFGDKVEFIVAYFQPGRSVSLDDGRYRNLIAQPLIPDDEVWVEATGGAQFVGSRFDEHPDAEEVYAAGANAKQYKWGKGPKISTTFNFTGLVVEPDTGELMPARISFLRSTKPAYTKLMQLKQTVLRNKPFWDLTFELSTAIKDHGRNTSYIVNVKKGRSTTPEEKLLASEVAAAVLSGRTVDNSEQVGAERAEAPADDGGLTV